MRFFVGKSIKVLHVYRTYFPDPPGGLQEAIRQICLSTKKYNVESRIFTLSPSPEPNELDFPEGKVFRYRSVMAPASCDIALPNIISEFKKAAEWADIINYHFPWPFADFLNLFIDKNKAKVMTYHSDIVRQKALGMMYSPLMQKMLRSMDYVVPTSQNYANTSVTLTKYVKDEQLKIVPLGIRDISSEAELADEAENNILEGLNILNKKFVLALGVLRYYKGFHTLVEAAKDIDGIVVIAGSGPEGERLANQAKSIGIENIVFAGQISNEVKHVLLKNCCSVVLPSHLRSEAFGMVLVEASMYSKPMVSCEIGSGTSFVNMDKDTGLVVAPENPMELSRAINLLFTDVGLSQKYALRARERFEILFSEESIGLGYFEIYSQLVES